MYENVHYLVPLKILCIILGLLLCLSFVIERTWQDWFASMRIRKLNKRHSNIMTE
jgi:hypothetical protein